MPLPTPSEISDMKDEIAAVANTWYTQRHTLIESYCLAFLVQGRVMGEAMADLCLVEQHLPDGTVKWWLQKKDAPITVPGGVV
jgi:hypothetical protein